VNAEARDILIAAVVGIGASLLIDA